MAEEEIDPLDAGEWQTACTASGMVHANIIIGKLESEGISARLKYEAIGPIYGLTADGLGKVEILVPFPLLERARQVLAEIYRDEEIPWENSLK